MFGKHNGLVFKCGKSPGGAEGRAGLCRGKNETGAAFRYSIGFGTGVKEAKSRKSEGPLFKFNFFSHGPEPSLMKPGANKKEFWRPSAPAQKSAAKSTDKGSTNKTNPKKLSMLEIMKNKGSGTPGPKKETAKQATRAAKKPTHAGKQAAPKAAEYAALDAGPKPAHRHHETAKSIIRNNHPDMLQISPIKPVSMQQEQGRRESTSHLPPDAVTSAGMHKAKRAAEPTFLYTPTKIRRLSLTARGPEAKILGIFKARRESLAEYESIYNGGVRPEDFHKHSNESQDKKTRIKQLLLWIVKHIASTDTPSLQLPREEKEKACAYFAKRVPLLVLNVLDTSPQEASGINITEQTQEIFGQLHAECARYDEEIRKWRHIGSSILLQHRPRLPLATFAFVEEAASTSFRRHSVAASVSFDATTIAVVHFSNIQTALSRKVEELNSALNSSRYFMFLSSEYTKKVCCSILEAAHPLDRARANALLRLLCRITRQPLQM